jgi:hypothetical protein
MLAVGVGASPVFIGGINANISGSSVLDTSIDAPVLTLAVSSTTYPPQLDIALSFGVQATIHSVRVQADDDYLFGSTFMDDLLPISDAEATAAIKLDSNLGSIVSPAVTFFRARIEWTVTGVTHYTNWSNTQGHGDAVAPSMTSSNSGTSAELVAMAFPITAGEVCYFAITGADAAFLELASSTPATSNTVRLTSNALLNYESKASYAFTITPTDLSGNVGTPQSCTFTVTDVDEIPNANPFTNVSNATTSTLYTSNVGTVSALAASISVPVTFSGTGQFRKNGGSWGTAATTATNGDTFEIQITSSASGTTGLTGTLSIGDPAVSWSYTVTTQSAVSPLFGGADIGYSWITTDGTKMGQNIDGTGTPAFTQLIGNLTDISGKNNTIAAAANDLTRPTWSNVNNGMLKFDGNDLLKSIGGFFAKGSTTVMMVVQDTQAQANNAGFIWAETNNTTTGAIYAPGTRQNVNQDVLNYQRNNALTAYAVQNLDTNIWDGTTHILTEIDDGTTVKSYKDGVLMATTASYTRTGTLTGNQSAFGDAAIGGTGSFQAYQGYLGSGLIIGRILTGAHNVAGNELNTAYNYFAGLHGLPTL